MIGKGRRERKARKAAETAAEEAESAGVIKNLATNLLIADVAMRMGSTVLRHAVERSFLKGRYGKGTAKTIVANRSIGHTLASTAVAKLATRSMPGAILIGGGIVAKALFDRSKARRMVRLEERGEDIRNS